MVKVNPNENNNFRGLHLVVINPKNGKVETARAFDTYESSEEFDKFLNTYIPDQYIIVAACKDECTTNLSNEVKYWFSEMGSKMIWSLSYREGFVFIGINGRKESYEKKTVAGI